MAQSDPSEQARNQHTLRNIGLICEREYKNQITQKSFITTSVIYLLVIIIGSFIPTIIQFINAHTNAPQTTMVVINQAGSVAGMSRDALLQHIKTSLNKPTTQGTGANTDTPAHFVVHLEDAAVLDAKQKAVKDGKLSALLVIDRDNNQDVRFTYYTVSKQPSNSDAIQVQTIASQLALLDRAERLHLNAEQAGSLFAPPQFAITNLQPAQDDRSVADYVTGLILAYVGVLLIYIAILLYGTGIAQGVAEEKGSRIMELLVLAATPFQLMAGKILGIGAAGLTQMVVLVLVGIGMLLIQTPIQSALLGGTAGNLSINITTSSTIMLLMILLYFILAFALYSSLFAAAGALVQRQDETRNAGMPITLLFMIGYIICVSLVAVPGVTDATWFKVMSYIPFWAPTMMLTRIAINTASWWEILITIVLMIISIPICAWISARIYRVGILMYGQRFSLIRILKQPKV